MFESSGMAKLRWIMPMTNAFGYAAHRREENSMDPNRDFPYLHTRPGSKAEMEGHKH